MVYCLKPACMTTKPGTALVFAGGETLYVNFADRIDTAINRRVLDLFHALRARSLPGIVDLVPSYRSLMIAFEPTIISDETLISAVQAALTAAQVPKPARRRVTIPVTYGGEYGPDLEDVARATGLTPDDIIRLHSEASYDVYFLGFTPGFPFLGGMPPALATPRRATPRSRVAGGSVGIAGGQTGIYPVPSPGGWQLIGRTPLPLCDLRPDAMSAVVLAGGDIVQFRPLDGALFQDLVTQSQGHVHHTEMEVIDEPSP